MIFLQNPRQIFNRIRDRVLQNPIHIFYRILDVFFCRIRNDFFFCKIRDGILDEPETERDSCIIQDEFLAYIESEFLQNSRRYVCRKSGMGFLENTRRDCWRMMGILQNLRRNSCSKPRWDSYRIWDEILAKILAEFKRCFLQNFRRIFWWKILAKSNMRLQTESLTGYSQNPVRDSIRTREKTQFTPSSAEVLIDGISPTLDNGHN